MQIFTNLQTFAKTILSLSLCQKMKSLCFLLMCLNWPRWGDTRENSYIVARIVKDIIAKQMQKSSQTLLMSFHPFFHCFDKQKVPLVPHAIGLTLLNRLCRAIFKNHGCVYNNSGFVYTCINFLLFSSPDSIIPQHHMSMRLLYIFKIFKQDRLSMLVCSV